MLLYIYHDIYTHHIDWFVSSMISWCYDPLYPLFLVSCVYDDFNMCMQWICCVYSINLRCELYCWDLCCLQKHSYILVFFPLQLIQLYNEKLQYINIENLLEWAIYILAILMALPLSDVEYDENLVLRYVSYFSL